MRRTLLFGFVVVLSAGCGRVTQIDPPNRRVMHGLQTAVSSKKVDWLEATVKLMEEQESNGELSEEEETAFQTIIEKARKGDWAGAQKYAFALSEGQRPTEEDLERIKSGPARKTVSNM